VRCENPFAEHFRREIDVFLCAITSAAYNHNNNSNNKTNKQQQQRHYQLMMSHNPQFEMHKVLP